MRRGWWEFPQLADLGSDDFGHHITNVGKPGRQRRAAVYGDCVQLH